MIAAAKAGPMPGSNSNSSVSAVLMLISALSELVALTAEVDASGDMPVTFIVVFAFEYPIKKPEENIKIAAVMVMTVLCNRLSFILLHQSLMFL